MAGLKQVDYDYAAMAETGTTAVPAQRKKIKDDRSPWSPKRRNKKSSNRKNNKNNKKNNKRQAVRTTRRAGTFNDQVELDDAGQNQLLGLGKPRPLPLPAPQLKPFVSVGVCKISKRGKKNKLVFIRKWDHLYWTRHTLDGCCKV